VVVDSGDVHAQHGIAACTAVGVSLPRGAAESFSRLGVDLQGLADSLRPYVQGRTAGMTWFAGPNAVRNAAEPNDLSDYLVSGAGSERAFNIPYRGDLPPTDRTKPIVLLPNGTALKLHFNEYGDEVSEVTPVDVNVGTPLSAFVVLEVDATYLDSVLYRYQYLV